MTEDSQTEQNRALITNAAATDRLTDAIGQNKRERRVGTIVASVAIVLLLVNGFTTTLLGVRILNNTSTVLDGQRTGHQLLQIATDATSPAAQARQQEQLAVLVGQIITCVENHSDKSRDPAHVTLIASCPQPEPVTP